MSATTALFSLVSCQLILNNLTKCSCWLVFYINIDAIWYRDTVFRETCDYVFKWGSKCGELHSHFFILIYSPLHQLRHLIEGLWKPRIHQIQILSGSGQEVRIVSYLKLFIKTGFGLIRPSSSNKTSTFQWNNLTPHYSIITHKLIRV